MQDEGFQFRIKDVDKSIRGTIAYFSADNLGAQYVGGFKQGSKAHRKCRECMAKDEEIQTKVKCPYYFATLQISGCDMQMKSTVVSLFYRKLNSILWLRLNLLCIFCSFVKTVLFFGQEKVMTTNANGWIRVIISKRHMV